MASPFQQQSTTRKFIYFGLILALFTVSLVHRKTVIEARANDLFLREVNRGKADLTDSALRLTLSGMRGVAATSMWLAAIDKQKRHEWNELEVIVESLTRLQPRFTSPWLFQSWNLSFNVAVECDRPRDKYYYITRGITLLARGEEKNDPGQADPPQPWPADPEMRYNVGFFYQLKISSSDEQKTMRCLFDLSSIPLAEREPRQFWTNVGGNQVVDLNKFRMFCENHPRLVRRLRERLTDFEKPEAIVEFLADNRDIPGRIADRTQLRPEQRLEEFPVLPPQDPRALEIARYPDWRSETLGDENEDFDVFVCMRAWYTYGQVPLPPANPDPSVDDEEHRFNRQKHRQTKMATIIFRSYPARAEAYFAENLQADGWFDESGWLITQWFDPIRPRGADGLPKQDWLRVGDGRKKYSSAAAWNKAFELYRAYGLANGLRYEPAVQQKLEYDADRFPNSPAKRKRDVQLQDLGMTNFNDFYFQSEVERTPEAVAARMAIFEAKAEHNKANLNLPAIYYEKVLPQWLDLLLRHPEFRQISTIQEETFELEAEYFLRLQMNIKYKGFFDAMVRDMAMAGAALSPSPLPDAVWQELFKSKTLKVMPIRNVEGPLDQLFVMEEPREPQGIKAQKALKTLAPAVARAMMWPPPPDDPQTPDFVFSRYVVWPLPSGLKPGETPEIGLGQQYTWPPQKALVLDGPRPLFLMLSSSEERKILTVLASHREPPAGKGWEPVVGPAAVQVGRERVQWMRPRGSETPEHAATPPQVPREMPPPK
jgi:hypothetical protein